MSTDTIDSDRFTDASDLLEVPVTPTPLADGFVFGEGPRWFEGLLWLSDMLDEAVYTVDLRGSLTPLPLPGRSPSGLGFRPDGSLLIASARDRCVLRYDGEAVTVLAELADLAPADLGDMVVDACGRCYVGSQAFAGGTIIRIDPDGSSRTVADGLDFPNGMVITPDGGTLVVAESVGRRLTAFTVDGAGDLIRRRTFAEGLAGPPDGIALDAQGGVWTAMTLAHRFERVIAGGAVTDRIDLGDRAAIACTLGGVQGRTLFLVTAADVYPERMAGTRQSRVSAVTVDVPGAGHP